MKKMMKINKDKKLYPQDDIYSEMDQVDQKIEEILTSALVTVPADEDILSAQIRVKNQLVHSINRKAMDQKNFVAQVFPEEGAATQNDNIQTSQTKPNAFMNLFHNKPFVIFSTLTLITIVTLSGIGIYYLNTTKNNQDTSTEFVNRANKSGDIVTLAKERFKQLYGIEYDDYVKVASSIDASSNPKEGLKSMLASTGRTNQRMIMAQERPEVQNILDNVNTTQNKGVLYRYTVEMNKADYTKYTDVYIPTDTAYFGLHDFIRYPEANYEYYMSLHSTGTVVRRGKDILYATVSDVSAQGNSYHVRSLEYRNGKLALEGNYIHPKGFYEEQNISYIQFTPDYILLQKLESKDENIKDLGVKDIDGVQYRIIEESINVLGPVYSPPPPAENTEQEESIVYPTGPEIIIRKTYYINPNSLQIVKTEFSEDNDLLFSIKYEEHKIIDNTYIQNNYNEVKDSIRKLDKEIKTFDFGAVYDIKAYPKLADFVKKYPVFTIDTDGRERFNFYDNDSEQARLYNEYFRLYSSQDFDPSYESSGEALVVDEGSLAHFGSMRLGIEYYKSGQKRSNIVCTGKKSTINIDGIGQFEAEVCKYSYDDVMTIQMEEGSTSPNNSLLPVENADVVYKLSQKIGSYPPYDIYISFGGLQNDNWTVNYINEQKAKQYDDEIRQIITMETVMYGVQIDQSKISGFIATPVEFVKKENYQVYTQTFSAPYYGKEETCVIPLQNAKKNPDLLEYLYMQHKFVLDCIALIADGYMLSYHASLSPEMYEIPTVNEIGESSPVAKNVQVVQSSFDVYIFEKTDFTYSALEFYINYLKNKSEDETLIPVYKEVNGYIVVIVNSVFGPYDLADDIVGSRRRLLENIRLLSEQEKKQFFDMLNEQSK